MLMFGETWKIIWAALLAVDKVSSLHRSFRTTLMALLLELRRLLLTILLLGLATFVRLVYTVRESPTADVLVVPITGSNTSATWLSPADWALVHQDILTQCDGRDGVVDGILEDPDLCQYRPDNLQCSSVNTTDCLTAPQVQTVRSVFEPYYGVDGSLIYPRMQPGSELADANIYYSGQPFPYTVDWLRYAILNDTTWQATNLTVQLAAYAAEANPYNIETWNGDLSPFKKRGGKLLHYHGLVSSSQNTDLSQPLSF